MKKFLLAVTLFTFSGGITRAQFNKILNKAKDKVQQRADNKVDKALDDLENGGKKKESPTKVATPKQTDGGADADTVAQPSRIKAYSRFDFVPGEKVLYAEDFAPDVIGELPLTWNSSGKGEVVTIDGKAGKWVRGHQGNVLLSGNKQPFGDNYTIEFDMIYSFQPRVTGYLLPNVSFGLFSSGDKETTDNSFLHGQSENASLEVSIHGSGDGSARVSSYNKGINYFHSDLVELQNFESNWNKVIHYSMQVQKSRFRLWQNEVKLFDVPRGIPADAVFNQLMFKLETSNYKDDEVGYYLGNIKVATGLPDTRHKLIDEGKFSTTGILFDFQSAVIKPESYGVIKEIAQVLKENPAVKLNIIGHTSNDGDATANLELSKQRAAALKAVLISEYTIEENRLQTDGKGGTMPVADNKTKEGKSQNRRVEFIKM